jgi:hypothetical protein
LPLRFCQGTASAVPKVRSAAPHRARTLEGRANRVAPRRRSRLPFGPALRGCHSHRLCPGLRQGTASAVPKVRRAAPDRARTLERRANRVAPQTPFVPAFRPRTSAPPLTCPRRRPSRRHPATDCASNDAPYRASSDCPPLRRFPRTAGPRRGFIRLALRFPLSSRQKRALCADQGSLFDRQCILRRTGEAQIDAAPALPIAEKTIAYIPPATRHNVKNTGAAPLEYVYVVAPAAEK